MAEDTVIKFFDAAHKNTDIQGQIYYALAKTDPDLLLQIAQENGYQFTSNDLKSVMDKQSELSAEQLDAIAGGSFTSTITDVINLGKKLLGLGDTPFRQFVDFSDEPEFVQVSAPK
ncbi:MAG: Nif11-like leader peptide family RiPP precursor [Elainella sp. C42_A2020_010]|nr:Nif11-like leader peptide family RiPP precursor [Elainella sp. C42_A2020_010]RNJ66148.1 MAG: Nif11-like leader peptide family natural product precursor [Leptolyngbya sp. IPPAS B-1204]